MGQTTNGADPTKLCPEGNYVVDCSRATGNSSLIWCDPVNIFESLG